VYNDQVKEDKVGGIHIGFWWESGKERDHWEDPDEGGSIILK
jgi:hypothetical protein